MRSVTVATPGTCGELVQGAIAGRSFLVSCPIDLYSTVTVELDKGSPEVLTRPVGAKKASMAVRVALRHFNRAGVGARLRIVSPLPRGKGMGSSTADVAGAIFAVALALGEDITPSQVAALALSIEPSDASMFPNIALFDHRDGTLYEDLGPPPPMELIVLDPGGAVDTVEFNQRDWSALLRAGEPVATEALALVRRGIRDGRPDLIGRGATLSAEANQRILFKPALSAVIEVARRLGSVGVNVGHSGTVIGILVDPSRGSARAVASAVSAHFPALSVLFTCRLIGGGCRSLTSL